MPISRNHRTAWLTMTLIVVALAAASACGGRKDSHSAFGTPDEAVDAFVAALQKDDVDGLRNLLGPGTEGLLSSGDAVADKADRTRFLDWYQAKHSLVPDGDSKMTLVVGDSDWPMPIPLVKRDGKWVLDGAAGADELVYRRVGGNELGAIAVCRGFVAAQLEYAAEGRDGDPPGIYALKLVSDEGLHNGLYWPTAESEAPSPAGEFVATAAQEGYKAPSGKRAPYHGYYYRLLYSQGANAKGGAREYFKNGLMTEGFALVAWPAEYGSSGMKTFIVNQDGVVFEKDLGENTAAAAEAIKSFDPDASWKAVETPAG